ncbi:hypothetical protein [Shimia sagamensis]|uniref:DUF2497 domain-containing protein n=1 Tax=Shimia sagamensis TaxID=1566352 RepID=A0ABY1NVG5_9RHOB|nr:hypothetical protein [Shimia sagamensis]SMP19245.1 hypothetical protein SAMN06265373_103398 [Shimia sagamensis]
MSDPVTNTEIEDVLTSIRRLVSENRPVKNAEETEALARPVVVESAVVQDDLAQSTPAPAEAPLALVLTPALRVEETPDESADVEDAGRSNASDEGEDAPFAEVAADEDFDTVALVVGDAEAEETEESDPDIDLVFVENQQDTVEEISAGESHLSDPERFAEAETEARDEADMSYVAVTDSAPDEAVDEEQPFDFKQVLEARIHQFRDATSTEEVIEVPATELMPDMAGAVVDEMRESMPEEVADAVDLSQPESFGAAVDEAAEIDEAMLREMVADIVRQELQGALGERITRNVRKLVRREIHRALAAHDLG